MVRAKCWNTASCAWCGNNTKEGSEACDGTDTTATTCNALGWTGDSTAVTSCKASCELDTSVCSFCDADVLVACGHYPDGGIGRVVRRDGRVVWEPA